MIKPTALASVLNVPCGVESEGSREREREASRDVPNAPCGVESFAPQHSKSLMFLVPNAPCGVERRKQ